MLVGCARIAAWIRTVSDSFRTSVPIFTYVVYGSELINQHYQQKHQLSKYESADAEPSLHGSGLSVSDLITST